MSTAGSGGTKMHVSPPPGFEGEGRRQRHIPESQSCMIVYLLDLGGKHLPALRIPPAYKHYVRDASEYNIMLEGLRGLDWMVKLQLLGSDYYLTEGWLNFVRGNGIQDRDQLCFSRKGRGRYKMQVCNRERVFQREAKTTPEFMQGTYGSLGREVPNYVYDGPGYQPRYVPKPDSTYDPTRFDPSRFQGPAEADQVEEDYQVDRVELSDGTGDEELQDMDVVNLLVDSGGEENDEDDGEEDDEEDDDVEDADASDSDDELWGPPAAFLRIVTHHNVTFPKKHGVLVPRLHEAWKPARGHRGTVELTWENGGSGIFQCVWESGKQWRIGAGWSDWVREVGLETADVLHFEPRSYGETPKYHVTINR